MNAWKLVRVGLSVASACGWMTVTSARADEKLSEKDAMAKMAALAQPGENHKILAGLVGSWDYKMKYWMEPGQPPSESGGQAEVKAVMGGRYFISDVSGTMTMPGPGGAPSTVSYEGKATDAFDNVRGKFVSTWIDNMGTSVTVSEGTYDPAAKALTYQMEMELIPGHKTKAREVITLTDKDHHTMEWYEEHHGKEVKTMELVYTRKP